MATFTFSNTSGLSIPDGNHISQSITAFGMTGTVTDVSVHLNGLTHTAPDDLDFLLTGPNGANNLDFFSDVSNFLFPLNSADLVFSDSAAAQPAQNTQIASGSYQPVDYGGVETNTDFGSSVPAINHAAPNGGATFASAFMGAAPNGTYSLFVDDDNGNGNTGSLSEWQANITTSSDVASVTGTAGNDTLLIALTGSATDEGIFLFNAGQTVAFSGVSEFHFAGGAGKDVFVGADEKDVATGDAGADTLSAGKGDDSLSGGDGKDLLVGGEGADKLLGGKGRDTASYEGAKADVQVDIKNQSIDKGDAAGDTLKSIENLVGSAHKDKLFADKHANHLDGGDGTDTLVGRGGNDTILGGNGADKITGGLGADHMNAGADKKTDIFVYESALDSGATGKTADQIFDFDRKNGHEKGTDKIDLRDLHIQFSDLGIVTKGGNVSVSVDTDGDGKANMLIKLIDVDHLHQADFLL